MGSYLKSHWILVRENIMTRPECKGDFQDPGESIATSCHSIARAFVPNHRYILDDRVCAGRNTLSGKSTDLLLWALFRFGSELHSNPQPMTGGLRRRVSQSGAAQKPTSMSPSCGGDDSNREADQPTYSTWMPHRAGAIPNCSISQENVFCALRDCLCFPTGISFTTENSD